MKCFTCGRDMKPVDDLSLKGFGTWSIYRCDKCNSYAHIRQDVDGFIKKVEWQAEYNWEDDINENTDSKN